MTDLVDRLKRRARDLGFEDVGVTDASASGHMDFYREWLDRGAHGTMAYLERDDAVARRANLELTLAEVRSVLVVTHGYDQPDPAGVPEDPSRAVIARYARGADYHTVILDKLRTLLDWLQEESPDPVTGKAYVDTGPVLERELASRAGLGWFGRNTMLIHPRRGSYVFLGVLLLDLDLPPDPPFEGAHCGSCRACLNACPTGALLGYDGSGAPVMDARRCISYLTIELKGPIPRSLRASMGNRVYGCDICQEVCPFNRKFSPPTLEAAYLPRRDLSGPRLIELAERLLALSERGFRRTFADSPVLRTRRKGLLRNVCVALGNWGSDAAVPTLKAALADPARVVRGHAAWGLGRCSSAAAREALTTRLSVEPDEYVREEIRQGLDA